jgi:hypothetical protein
MTDYRRLTPVTISRSASLDDANRAMTLCRVQYLLVTDEQQQLLGIVTEAGTRGNQPLAVAHRLGMRPGELVVGNVMIDKHDEAEVLHLRDVAQARVGNVVATLKELGTPFCLVVDHDEEDHHVLCGVFLPGADPAPDGAGSAYRGNRPDLLASGEHARSLTSSLPAALAGDSILGNHDHATTSTVAGAGELPVEARRTIDATEEQARRVETHGVRPGGAQGGDGVGVNTEVFEPELRVLQHADGRR